MPLLAITHANIPLSADLLASETVQEELTKLISSTKKYFLAQIRYSETETDLVDDDEEVVSASDLDNIKEAIIAEVKAKFLAEGRPDIKPAYMGFYAYEAYYYYLRYHTIGIRY